MTRMHLASVLAVLAAAPLAAQQAPALGAPPRLTLPAVQKGLLPNGLRLDVVPMRDVPLVQATLIIDGGARLDGPRPGLALFTAAMLKQGAGGRSALALDEELEHLGARLSTGATWDATTLVLRAPRRTFPVALALLSSVVREPGFASADVERERDLLLASLVQRRAQPAAVAGVVLGRALFPAGHPYHVPLAGDSTSVAVLDSAVLRDYWDSVADPRRATLILTGDVTQADARRLVTEAFGSWRSPVQPAPAASLPPSPAASPTRVVLVDKPGAPQSVIAIGAPGVPRTAADYAAITLMNTILGGSYSARLNDVLREQRGYSYGAFSQFVWRPLPGPFVAQSAVRADVTDSALHVFVDEFRRIRDEPVSAAELERARAYLMLGALSEWETTGDVATQLATLHAFGLPLATVQKERDAIAKVTAADVQRAARRHLDPGRLTVVVVGDLATVQPGIEALQLGPIERRDVDGRPIR
jgi:zinc protease